MFSRIRLMSSMYQPLPRPPKIWPTTMILLSLSLAMSKDKDKEKDKS